jgi:Fe-S-cluster containining protein
MKAHKETKTTVFRKLAILYKDMEDAYTDVATSMELSCKDCEDNCCTSYFMHHTYVEWAYLWKGMDALAHKDRELFLDNARAYVAQANQDLASGKRPHIMCPLNKDGLCGLYSHRLMICRMHGVPNTITAPNGSTRTFPGCFKSQERIRTMESPPMLDRTPLYIRLVQLEQGFLGPKRIRTLPRVNMTLAEMLVQGPPKV